MKSGAMSIREASVLVILILLFGLFFNQFLSNLRTIRQVERRIKSQESGVRKLLLTKNVRSLDFETITYRIVWSRSISAQQGLSQFYSWHKPLTPKESKLITHDDDDIRSKAFVVFWVDEKRIIRRIDLGVRDVGHGIISKVNAEKEAMEAALGTGEVPEDALEKWGWSPSGSSWIYDCDEFLTRGVITEPVFLSDLSEAAFIHRANPDGRMIKFTGSWFLLFSDAGGNILERVPYDS